MADLGQSLYFIGIGGIGMSGVAKVLLSQGKRVSGSDTAMTALTRELEEKGAQHLDATGRVRDLGMKLETEHSLIIAHNRVG